MAGQDDQEDGKPCLFIKGHFSDRIKAGERPGNKDYPKSSLPEVPKGSAMPVGRSFLDAVEMEEKNHHE